MFEDWVTMATPRSTALPAMLVGPERRAVEIVQKAHSSWARGCGISPAAATSRSCKAPRRPSPPRLAEAGGEADRAARTHGGQLGDHVDGRLAVHADEGGVGRAGQVGKTGHGGQAAHLGLCRMHRPDRAREPDLRALPDDIRAPGPAADHGDGAGAEQAVERLRMIRRPAAGRAPG
jgi:hypothetical protein